MRYKHNFIAAILILFVATTLSASNLSEPTDEQTVKQAVTEYAQSIDNKDLATLDNILYDDANFIMINKLRNNEAGYDKNEFINLVKKGTLGGWERNLNILKVDLTDNAAIAKIEITDNKVKTCEFVSLVNIKGKWLVAGSTISIDKL